MTKMQLNTLGYFSENEKDLGGVLVDWKQYAYETMYWVDVLRGLVESPCTLIRGDHGVGKENAVDFTFARGTMGRVAMELMRLPGLSWGIYIGGSYHMDSRKFEQTPARWMAIKTENEISLYERGLEKLIVHRTRQWTYLRWSDNKAFEALAYIIGRR